MSRTDSSGAQISPQDVRRKHFSVRLRGVDYGEVRFFLAGLADELEVTPGAAGDTEAGEPGATRRGRGGSGRP